MNRDPTKPVRAKLFRHGGSQAVRLPKEFRMPGTEVTVRPSGRGVLIEPADVDVDAWLERLHAFNDVPFMEEGQPARARPDEPDPLD
jgi:antitoxin VapB